MQRILSTSSPFLSTVRQILAVLSRFVVSVGRLSFETGARSPREKLKNFPPDLESDKKTNIGIILIGIFEKGKLPLFVVT